MSPSMISAHKPQLLGGRSRVPLPIVFGSFNKVYLKAAVNILYIQLVANFKLSAVTVDYVPTNGS